MITSDFGRFSMGWERFHWCFSSFCAGMVIMSLCWVGTDGVKLFILIILFGFYCIQEIYKGFCV